MIPEPGTDQPSRSMQERFPPRCRSLRGLWWSILTQVQKKKITWEDRAGRFGYAKWIKTVEQAQIDALLQQAKESRSAAVSTLFLIAGGDSSRQSVANTVRSLQQQGGAWQAALVLPEASALRQERWFLDLLQAEPRLHGVTGQPAWMPGLKDGLAQFTGAWLVPLRWGDVLAEHWVDLFALYAQRFPGADIFYWDEDTLSPDGARSDPFFKPDWSPELFLSFDYLGSAAFRREFLQSMDFPDPAGWIFDVTAAARQMAHIPLVMQHRQALSREDRARALAGHAEHVRAALERRGFHAVSAAPLPEGALRLSWQVPPPLVSIIIPTKDNLMYLKRTLDTLLERTIGAPFEIIVMDDHSTNPEVLDYYQALQRKHSHIRVVANDGEFNYSAVNNAGARLAKGDLLLFLNNDVEIIEAGWLSEMVRWACMPGVGMVGAKLLYPDGSIQHAGIVVGMTGHAGHLYIGKPSCDSALFISPNVVRDVSAVTGACMMIRRDLFEALGGFDEALVLVFNDVDLCLRVLRAGYRVVYTPAATLIHYEGRSRAHYMPPRDIRLGAERLSAVIQSGDRYYNPNLSLAVDYPSLRRAFEPPASARLKKIIQYKG